MNTSRKQRILGWLIALTFATTVAACATEIEFEDEYAEDIDGGEITEEELEELQSIEESRAELSGTCTSDAQCQIGAKCVDRKCKTLSLCVDNRDCTGYREECKAGYCIDQESPDNNPCANDAALAMSLRLFCDPLKNEQERSECIWYWLNEYNCWAGRRTPLPRPPPPPTPTPTGPTRPRNPIPNCTTSNDVCSTTSDCCSGLTCRSSFGGLKTCQ